MIKRIRKLPGISLWVEREGELGLQRKGFGSVTNVDAMDLEDRAQTNTEKERELDECNVRVLVNCEVKLGWVFLGF